MKREDVFFEAMRTRDPRFDGKFFVGVKTTGIYCRPICPAKPKRENVEFFGHALAAEKAGYRPCLRCRPESAPHSPAWIGKSAIVLRALKALRHREQLDLDEDAFAAQFGVSARHLRRLFQDEIGKTPTQLWTENRLNLARQLLTETALPITDVAFAAGFQSVRRFNSAFKERFKKPPREIRRQRVTASDGLVISLSYRPPFDFVGLMTSYRRHRMGDLEWFEGERMHRMISVDGKRGEVAIWDDPARSRLMVRLDLPDTTLIPMVISRVRAMFDLDSDPVLIANALETDRELRKKLKLAPGIRLPSGWDPFEIGVATILGQLVSVERGRALVHDLIDLAGSPSGLIREGKEVHLFPTPQQVLKADLKPLKTTAIRKDALRAFARAVASGELSLLPTQDVEEFKAKALSLRGIGPWSAQYMALKILRDTDGFPASDLVLARALQEHPRLQLENMRPWRGYAAALLWRTSTASQQRSSR